MIFPYAYMFSTCIEFFITMYISATTHTYRHDGRTFISTFSIRSEKLYECCVLCMCCVCMCVCVVYVCVWLAVYFRGVGRCRVTGKNFIASLVYGQKPTSLLYTHTHTHT